MPRQLLLLSRAMTTATQWNGGDDVVALRWCQVDEKEEEHWKKANRWLLCCGWPGQKRSILLWVVTNGAAGGQIGPVGGAGVPLDGAGLLGDAVSTTARVVLAGAEWCCPRGGAGKKGLVVLGERLRRRYEVVGGRGSPAGEVLQKMGSPPALGFFE
ncbi:uncharacterized protein LOC110271524 [Arachis ipaensis]|uniref:uncharacterized protein LOC110271524 n=1 Tax=Arachis ipaensis TaxID=130454 RepID=UPI000A2AF1EF|nr:uncharacterized protein LOC110271524 [Arachis ipaensis]